jgi:hypothetical protein
VPLITEVTGNFNASSQELVKGIPTQAKFQFSVQNAWSNFFDIVNDNTYTVNKLIYFLLKN